MGQCSAVDEADDRAGRPPDLGRVERVLVHGIAETDAAFGARHQGRGHHLVGGTTRRPWPPTHRWRRFLWQGPAQRERPHLGPHRQRDILLAVHLVGRRWSTCAAHPGLELPQPFAALRVVGLNIAVPGSTEHQPAGRRERAAGAQLHRRHLVLPRDTVRAGVDGGDNPDRVWQLGVRPRPAAEPRVVGDPTRPSDVAPSLGIDEAGLGTERHGRHADPGERHAGGDHVVAGGVRRRKAAALELPGRRDPVAPEVTVGHQALGADREWLGGRSVVVGILRHRALLDREDRLAGLPVEHEEEPVGA